MADESATSDEEEVEAEVEVPELDVLMETERTFPPPPEFAAEANISDPGVYERADSDPEAWWASWAEKLAWIEPFDEVLDWSDPPHAKWFVGGKLNVSANCLDRHVEEGRGDRVAFLWEGEDASPGVKSPTRSCSSETQKRRQWAQGPRHRQGRRRRHLHADGPRGRGRDARLRPDRRHPQRRLRRLLGRVRARADGVLRGQGADHRRRDDAPRQADADEGEARRGRWRACPRSST